jgi:3-hydroxyacyl-CoA dehydrogenase/enoyl-CoA hydratase/3-hydroxybutyryl-CoA epimerase
MQPLFAGRFAPTTVFEQLRGQGWLGQKSGWGFYRYDGEKKRRVNDAAVALLRSEQPASLLAALPAAVRQQQARDRMVLLMVNEAVACLAEKLAADAGSIDLAMILGTGWAPHRGGPLRYAEDRGYREVVQTLADLARRSGPRFEPNPELRRRAEAEKEAI